MFCVFFLFFFNSKKRFSVLVKKNQLHAVFRTTGYRGNPCVKTLRSPLSAEFRRHCVLSEGTQHRALPQHQSEEI